LKVEAGGSGQGPEDRVASNNHRHKDMINTAVPGGRRWELTAWDISNLAYIWQIEFREQDAETEETKTENRASKFATNFEVSNNGILEKIGLKLGASL
jgi:hypothetical protein